MQHLVGVETTQSPTASVLGLNQWVFQLAVPPRRTMSCYINKGHLAKLGDAFQLNTLLKLLHIKMIANKLLQLKYGSA